MGNLELARRLRAAGIRIHIPEDEPEAPPAPPEGILVYQAGGVTESLAFDFYGGAGFIVSLIITPNLSGFSISAFHLELPWEDTIQWLSDPLDNNAASTGYRFGGQGGLEFDRDQVLNHHADIRRIIPRGVSLSGLLLGFGSGSIPDRFRHGAMIPAFISITDQYMCKSRSPVTLWADRSARLSPATRPTRRRKRLFECPDPGFGDAARTQHETEDEMA